MNVELDKERRTSPRIPVTVKCWLERESITLLGTITNVSQGGLFFRTPVSVAKGSIVDLRMNIGGKVLAVRGHVAWTAKPMSKPQNLGFGIGLDESEQSKSLFRVILDAKEDKLP